MTKLAQILFIDGNREHFENAQKMLTQLDDTNQFTWAGSAVPAQMILESSQFDVVFASYMLADLDGLTLLQRLRQNGNEIPFFLITGQKNKALEEKAGKFGANATVTFKELKDNPQQILEMIAKLSSENGDQPTNVSEEIRELKQQAAFFQINPAPVLQAQYNGIIVNHNMAAREFFATKLKGKKLTDIFKGLNLYDVQIIANYGVSQIEQKIGEQTFLFTFRSDIDNKMLYVFGSDISDRINAETELRRAHSQNELMLESISSILISVDRNGYIRQWNKVASEIFGIDAEKIIGRPFLESGITWRDSSIKNGMKDFLETIEPIRLESIRFQKPDGNDSFLSITISPILNRSGEASGFLMLGDDISERKILEDQLSQAQKLEAIGQLAAGIAHEINTPTQYIGDNTHFLHDSFKDVSELFLLIKQINIAHRLKKPVEPLLKELERLSEDVDLDYLLEEVPAAIQQSLEGIERVSKIVKAMKEFSHPGSEEKTSIDVNKAISSTITVARNEWKYVAEMKTDFDEALPPLPCYPGELNQVFLNIITNAAHAIGDRVNAGEITKGEINISTRLDRSYAEIRIADSGGGIPEKIRKKVFEPFFTTKEVGKGTGQGLAISHNVIVDKHGGTLAFESEQGIGTTFIIRLPLRDPDHDE
jgi:PAS domain S-box-containing protein